MNELNTSRNPDPRLVGKTSQVSDSRKIDQEAMQFAQLMNASSPSASNHCKFKETDKLLVVSVDDLDSHPQKMKQLTDYLRTSGIPATLFPHSRANPEVLNSMSQLPNTRLGWHGIAPGKLDNPPQAGVDKTVIAWSHGEDYEGRERRLGSNEVARGTRSDGQFRINEFDQHNIPSFTINNDEPSIFLEQRKKDVLSNGGLLSYHLHNSTGLKTLSSTVNEFRKNDGKIVHLSELKGCGKY